MPFWFMSFHGNAGLSDSGRRLRTSLAFPEPRPLYHPSISADARASSSGCSSAFLRLSLDVLLLLLLLPPSSASCTILDDLMIYLSNLSSLSLCFSHEHLPSVYRSLPFIGCTAQTFWRQTICRWLLLHQCLVYFLAGVAP